MPCLPYSAVDGYLILKCWLRDGTFIDGWRTCYVHRKKRYIHVSCTISFTYYCVHTRALYVCPYRSSLWEDVLSSYSYRTTVKPPSSTGSLTTVTAPNSHVPTFASMPSPTPLPSSEQPLSTAASAVCACLCVCVCLCVCKYTVLCYDITCTLFHLKLLILQYITVNM